MKNTIYQKIGIMGGTFDPIHYGHLLIAQSAAEKFDLDKILFLPTGMSPHKKVSQVTSPEIRCEMTALAIADNPTFSLSDIEAKSTCVNYTYQTLAKFKKIYPDTQLFFIMGEDSLNDFSSWKNPQEICKLAALLIAVRNNGSSDIHEKILKTRQTYQADIYKLDSPNFDVASRDIREKIRTGKSVQYMIPDAVNIFIQEKGLYLDK